MSREPDLKEREQTARCILRRLGENWGEPLGWNFRVDFVPPVSDSEAGYRITAYQEQTFEIKIGAKKARSYLETERAIKLLEDKAVGA